MAHFIVIGLVGLAAGFMGGLLGVGGGILFVPAFLYLLRDQIHDAKMAIGTSMAVIVFVAVVASIQNARYGRINWTVVALTAAFAIPGSWLGAWAMQYVGSANLRRLFAVLLIIVAIKMLLPDRKSAPLKPEVGQIGNLSH